MFKIHYGGDGRPNGRADVVSGSAQEAKMAMTKHEQNMQSRYVELWLSHRLLLVFHAISGIVIFVAYEVHLNIVRVIKKTP